MSRDKRAAAGESSIFQGADGRWHGYVTMGRTETGKRDRRHVERTKRAAVVKRVRELEQQRDAGMVLAAGSATTVGKWLDHWLNTVAKQRVREGTWTGYESKVRVHIKPALGHHQLERLQPEHLEAFYAARLAAGLAPGTVLVLHRILSRALKVAMQRGRVARNVATLVDPPSSSAEEVEPLTTAEARKVLVAARKQRNAARWSVALALGLRQGEALGARWEHVDLEAGVWRVREQRRRNPYRHGCGGACEQDVKARACPERTGGMLVSEPKTARGRRDIGIPPQMVADLRAHRQKQLEERLAAGSAWEDHGYVFAQRTGRPLDNRRDYGAWLELLAAAGVRRARLHDARHTAATLLLEQRVPPRVVMEILGHSTIAVTQNIYGHVMPEAVSQATTAVADVLWAPEATGKATKRPRGRSSS